MKFVSRHFCFWLGYCPIRDARYSLAMAMFRKDVPKGQTQFRFYLDIGCDSPSLFRVYDAGEHAREWGAIDSARWTGRKYAIWGWNWYSWFDLTVGQWHRSLTLSGYRWTPASVRRRANQVAARMRARQERLNSAMISARINDPRAPDWLIRSRAMANANLN